MPLYLYNCATCNCKREVVRPIAQIDDPVDCLRCAGGMTRRICAPAVRGDYAGYDCPVTGKRVEGRRAHEENLKRQGCRVFEPGEREAAQRAKTASDAALENLLANTAAELYAGLPSASKEKLAAEIDNGAEASIIRS